MHTITPSAVTDVLDYARIKAEKLRLDPVPGDDPFAPAVRGPRRQPREANPVRSSASSARSARTSRSSASRMVTLSNSLT